MASGCFDVEGWLAMLWDCLSFCCWAYDVNPWLKHRETRNIKINLRVILIILIIVRVPSRSLFGVLGFLTRMILPANEHTFTAPEGQCGGTRKWGLFYWLRKRVVLVILSARRRARTEAGWANSYFTREKLWSAYFRSKGDLSKV